MDRAQELKRRLADPIAVVQALGIADVLAVSYFHAMSYRPDDPEWEPRDRFLLSIGHYAIALYAALIEVESDLTNKPARRRAFDVAFCNLSTLILSR